MFSKLKKKLYHIYFFWQYKADYSKVHIVIFETFFETNTVSLFCPIKKTFLGQKTKNDEKKKIQILKLKSLSNQEI